jgi:hypothetical protein
MTLKLGAWPFLLATALYALPLAAQPDEATRTAARALGTAGVESYQAGDYAAANDKLEKAYGLLQVPTLGLWSGRALVKLGKWVEATDRFLEVTSLQVPAGEYAVQKQAQADAMTELKDLSARVPLVSVKVEGAALSDCSFTIDAQPVASSLLTAGRLMNPGKHVIEAHRGSDVARTEITVAEGERTTAVLKFPATTPAVVPPPVPPPPISRHETTESGGSAQRTWGWVTLAAGGVGLAVGGITGGLAVGKKHELESNPNCTGTRCASSEQDEVSSYNGMNTISTIGFIGGGVLAATGVVLLLTAPSATRTQAFIGPQSVGLRGRF